MFTPLGLFKDVPCPHGQQCSLGTCIFSHARNEQALRGQSSTRSAQDDGAQAYTPLPKRIKLSDPAEDRQPAEETSLPSENGGRTRSQNSQRTSHIDGGRQRAVRDLASVSREVSPPPTKFSTQKSQQRSPVASSTASASLQPSMPARQAPKESLNPRMLPKAPASHAARSSILNKLHATMNILNQKLEADKERPSQYLILTPQELVTMALDEEEKIARENPSVYPNVIKLRIVKLSKMNTEDWAKEVEAHLNSRYYKTAPRKEPQQPAKFTTGLSSQEEIAVCRKLITPLKGLEKYGYVTKPPSDDEVSSARKGVIESKGWEKCDRCGGRFQVFPGRREDGTLTSGGECTYHPARPLYSPKKQTDHITGHKDPYYPCCHETVGTSAGCTKAKTHVFKVSESKRLASILQFEETPSQPDKGPQQPVCFDCEMGYTTLGLELIRLTAVTWPDGKDLIDVLVRPMGEILDLNSRYSGVFPEHMSKAIPYGATILDAAEAASEDEKIKSAPLQIVESVAAARALLFSFLQPDTPLIGHAIDNDLNTCRIIHPKIIDTVLLFPHPRGLPSRLGLRALCKKHLDRDIQTAGAQGHDSREDAIATGDLVRFKAAETWKVLKGKGWRIENDRLVAPPGVEDSDETTSGARSLGPGAGHKRKPSESQS